MKQNSTAQKPAPPSEYLLLRQPPGKPCEIVHVFNGKEAVHFIGPRWPARHALRDLRKQWGFAVRAFNQKKGRNGQPGALVEMTGEGA